MRSRTILLVEDSQNDVDLTLRAFAKSTLVDKISVARNGEEALHFLFATGAYASRAEQPLPEVVLLDLKLPKVDGFGVLKRMRANERTRRLPVVVLTSSNEERDLIQSYALGANSFIRKPVNFSEFVNTARELGHYWLVLNQAPAT